MRITETPPETPKPETVSEVNLLTTIALLDEPVSELWRDARAMRDKNFPYEAREQRRQKELHNLHLFDAIEDATPERGEHTPDMVWIEEYRGDEVRARLCLRQYKQENATMSFLERQIPGLPASRLGDARAIDSERCVSSIFLLRSCMQTSKNISL